MSSESDEEFRATPARCPRPFARNDKLERSAEEQELEFQLICKAEGENRD